MYFLPRLWLFSTGASLGARENSPENGRLAEVRSFSSRLVVSGAFGSSASPERGVRNSPYWMNV